MHSKKLLHRDIKPENIVVVHVLFVLTKGIVKLCDFGWAVYRGNDLRSTFCGTPLYLSPELLLGRSYDEKADLWSVGILSYELVVGQLTKIITD
jgi:serine/threonine protein kinase